MSNELTPFAIGSVFPFFMLSEIPNRFAHDFCNETVVGALNYVWLTPVSIATNLAAMAIGPLVSLVDLVAAAFFALVSCCCTDPDIGEEWYKSAKDCLFIAIASSTIFELTALSRIFNVNANYDTV